MTPDEHTVALYTTSYGRGSAWGVCACTWQSGNYQSARIAQWAWANHVADVVRTLRVQMDDGVFV